jgi:hypothetical protein
MRATGILERQLRDRPGPWTKAEWLEWASVVAALHLRRGEGFGVSAFKDRARTMWGPLNREQRNTMHYELGARVMYEYEGSK